MANPTSPIAIGSKTRVRAHFNPLFDFAGDTGIAGTTLPDCSNEYSRKVTDLDYERGRVVKKV
jgi:hypothetical protein